MDNKQANFLDVPLRRVNDTGAFKVDLHELRTWINGLALANLQETGTEILRTLRELNRSELKREARLAPTDIFFHGILRVAPALRDTYIRSAMPLAPRDEGNFQLTSGMLMEAAFGFKLAALESWNLLLDKQTYNKGLHLAIQRSMLCLGQVHLEHYCAFRPLPPFVWRDVYRLYEMGESIGATDMRVPHSREHDDNAPGCAMTLHQIFSQMMAAALVNPFHLAQGEADLLFELLAGSLFRVKILALGHETAGRRFVADFAADAGPKFSNMDSGVDKTTLVRGRVLDVSELVEALQTAQSNRPNQRTSVGVDLVTRVTDSINDRGDRRESRAPGTTKLSMVFGLATIHNLLGARITPPPEELESALLASHTGSLELSLSPNKAVNEANLPLHVDRWMRKNHSKNGLSVFCPARIDGQTRTGDLVAIAEGPRADQVDWHLGAVRWIKTRSNGGIDAGIKLIGLEARPLFARAVRGRGMQTGYARGLLMSPYRDANELPTLVVAAGLFDATTYLLLNFGDSMQYARLKKVRYSTHLFTEFELQPVREMA